MTELLMHPKTSAELNRLASKAPQGMAITGPAGAGKFAVAKHLAAKILDVPADKLGNYPYLHILSRAENKQDIAIGQIRGLSEMLRLKTPGLPEIRRVVIIEDAQFLSLSAQNSLLKILEEPPADTVFILTTPHINMLLPTIRSRLQEFPVQPIAEELSRKYFQSSSEAAVRSAWALSQGSAGLMSALLSDSGHPLKDSVDKFKNLLKRDRYERLVELDKLEKDRVALTDLLEAGNRIVAALHADAIAKGRDEQARKFLAARQQLLDLSTKLQANTSPRLIVLDLALSLPI